MKSQLWLGIVIVALTATITIADIRNDLNEIDSKTPTKQDSKLLLEKKNGTVRDAQYVTPRAVEPKRFSQLPTKIKLAPSTTESILEKKAEEKTFENDIAHSEIGKKEDYNYDDDYDNDDDYYHDADNSTADDFPVYNKTEEKLIPIKIDTTRSSPSTASPKKVTDDPLYQDDADYDNEENDDDDDEEEEEDETTGDDNISYDDYPVDKKTSKQVSVDDDFDGLLNTHTKCPRDCICERNLNNYMVATCSRLDVDIQKFDSTITDLEVVNIGPKYPIVLGENFFTKIGLKNVESIKITNCTIENIAPSAFAGLDKLYVLNLSNTGITLIHPNAFTTNLRLKILTLANNDLNMMQHKISQYSNYMLKAPSVEEFDISNCNLNELLETAFNELKNVVYINLSKNKLKTLPESIFDKVETIEELDLEFNEIETLPKNIFNKTSLAILNLQNNKISKDLDFITSDLQRLNLGYCDIKSITSQLFQGMDGIYDLNLKGNGIKKIHPVAFDSMKSLRNIDLSFNDIDQISDLTFRNNRELNIVKLNDNRRLRKLPLEGFAITHGSFNIYHFDVSNCDIAYLGENTFSTMPQLANLNLSFNSLKTLSKGVFSYLNRLMDLDIGYNYITNLNDNTFMYNKNLKKLKINGNPIKSLSTRLFAPLNNLAELDVSECDLETMWKESSPKSYPVKVLRKLRYLNISYNAIPTIYSSDLDILTNLHVLDISNNPLECDTYFQKLIKMLTKKQIKASDNLRDRKLAPLNTESFLVGSDEITWDDISRDVCQSQTQILTSDEKKDNVDSEDVLIEDSSEYEDDSEEVDNENKFENPVDISKGSNEIVDKGVRITEVDVIEEIKHKVINEFDQDDDGEYILESRPFARRHFMYKILIILTSVILLLLLTAKIVSMIVKRRGERYRQAILDSKNSIIYQKLSEEVGPQTPKVHRYMPIQQV